MRSGRRGRPLVAEDGEDSIRCEALTVMTPWKKYHKKEERCPFVSKFIVGKKELCRHHAINEALAICIESGAAKRILRTAIRPDGRVRTIKDKR